MKNIEKKIKNKEYLAKGKRSVVYIGEYKNKKVCIKVKRKESKAKDRLKNEGNFLSELNKYNVGPKLIERGDDYIIYHYVSGVLLPDYLKKDKIDFQVIKNILFQCRILDKLKINKLEFTNPTKHIFIKKNKATIIDFERCYKTEKPKNVTQFCQYLMGKDLKKHFNINKEHFKEILKEYKKNQTENNFKKIINYLENN